MTEYLNINGLNINNIDNKQLLDYMSDAINNAFKKNISYANANTINLIYRDKSLLDLLSSFDLIHPDGIGIYFASKILYGKDGLKQKITGSDFYPILAKGAIKNNWKIFFFGHDKDTLSKIKFIYPQLNICGYNEGYNFDNITLLDKINSSSPNILIIGLGFPGQEQWILENCGKLNYNVCLAVGEGIGVFAGTKLRGPVILRKIGLEWLVRVVSNPIKYGKRYIIGNPMFLYRMFRLKMSKFGK
jgi:N-acetylglucosaminyldiphosphoundecaprenol N-acetyl-beta-D-mannosaminyltransferase